MRYRLSRRQRARCTCNNHVAPAVNYVSACNKYAAAATSTRRLATITLRLTTNPSKCGLACENLPRSTLFSGFLVGAYVFIVERYVLVAGTTYLLQVLRACCRELRDCCRFIRARDRNSCDDPCGRQGPASRPRRAGCRRRNRSANA